MDIFDIIHYSYIQNDAFKLADCLIKLQNGGCIR